MSEASFTFILLVFWDVLSHGLSSENCSYGLTVAFGAEYVCSLWILDSKFLVGRFDAKIIFQITCFPSHARSLDLVQNMLLIITHLAFKLYKVSDDGKKMSLDFHWI